MKIVININLKKIWIDCYTSFNFTEIDLSNVFFIWYDSVIVGSICMPADGDFSIVINDTKSKEFTELEAFITYFNKNYKNLVK